jgi:hypothetical protein
MVMSGDSVALKWQETSAAYTLDHVKISGSTFEMVFYIPPMTLPPDASEERKAAASVSNVFTVRGFAADDHLYGYMRADGAPSNSVPWTPFMGRRAMLSAPPAAMAKGGPPP